jgi:hypothetical protein
MKNLMQNKLALLGIGAVVIVVAIVGFIFFNNSKKAEKAGTPESVEEQAVTIKPEDIGLKLSPSADATEVVMEITDVSKFNSFEYEMNYDAEVEGEVVPRGAIGSGEINPGETSIKRSITIGTCSAGKCKYDKGVKKISFIIRLNLKDGQTGIVKKDLDLISE